MKMINKRRLLLSLGVLIFLIPVYVFFKRTAINSTSVFGALFEKFDTIYFFVSNKLFTIAYGACPSSEIALYEANFFFCTKLTHITLQVGALFVQVLLYYILSFFITTIILALQQFFVRIWR